LSTAMSMSVVPLLGQEQPEARLWLASLDLADEQVAPLWDYLSQDERERAERFHFERDRNRFVVARAALRHILAAQLTIEPTAIGFAYGPHGKPLVAPPLDASDLRFNVSHSAGTALIALAHGYEVGVDVEQLRTVPEATTIARRYFSRRERAPMEASKGAERDRAFMRCWTRKEAYLKGIGLGLSERLTQIEIIPTVGECVVACEVVHASRRRLDWIVHDVDVGDDLIAALAINRER
jgi:4'-phosphopantetheinyl transferase